MTFYRGTGSSNQSYMSQMDNDVMDRFHKGFKEGEIKEKGFTDRIIPLGPTSWHHDAVAKPDHTFPITKVANYMDGPHHKSRLRCRRDDEIKKRLTELGWLVHRWDYKRPTKKLVEVVFNIVAADVNKRWPG